MQSHNEDTAYLCNADPFLAAGRVQAASVRVRETSQILHEHLPLNFRQPSVMSQ